MTTSFADALVESVRLRTVSDRPVGLFLSGGVDSATVASILAASGHREITAYTAAFPGTEFDESATAARVANRLGLKHEILPIESHIGDDFERIVAGLDEPFADPSSFPAVVHRARRQRAREGGARRRRRRRAVRRLPALRQTPRLRLAPRFPAAAAGDAGTPTGAASCWMNCASTG